MGGLKVGTVMYLSKLELQGFKSFADRTVLHFDPGITAIVGPNGCGKSNLVDAVRWVIGEQRARVLRSERMEHVIFNGTARRRPVGMAEVLLTIENTRGILPLHYSEVTIGRRLYRSGESEYLLNGTPCRLRDIQELFMDTGMGAGAYSVIELKMIEDILSDNAQDRRHLFEEAAGITRYKLRRAQTLRKLDATRNDLTRLRDLIEEVRRQVDTLKRQADRAERYRRYRDELRTLEQALLRHDYDRLREQADALEALLDEVQTRLREARTRYEALEAEQTELQQQLTRTETALEAAQERLHTLQNRLQALESEGRLLDERLRAARSEQERLQREAEEAARQEQRLQQALEAAEAAVREAMPRHEAAEAALRRALEDRDAAQHALEQQRERVREARRLLQQAEQALLEARRQLDRQSNRRELLEQERERLDAEQKTLDAQLQALETEQEEILRKRETARQTCENLRKEIEVLERRRQELRQEIAARDEALHQQERRLEAVRAEARLLEQVLTAYEDFPEAVPFLARTPGWTDAPLQTVADLLGIAPELQPALDAALGERAAWIVVATEEEARQALRLLREAEKGRATFIVLEGLTPPNDPPEIPGARPLLDHVRLARPELRPLAASLLHDAYLVDDLETARRLAQSTSEPARFFTPQGEWIDSRNWWHGGSAQAPRSPLSGRLDRRERLNALQTEAASLETEIARLRNERATLEQQLQALPFDAKQQTLREAEQALRALEQQATRHEATRESLRQRLEALKTRRAQLDEAQATLATELQTLRQALAEAEQAVAERQRALQEAEAALQQAEAGYRAAMEQLNQVQLQAAETRNRLENLRREQQQLRQRLEGLRRRQQERAQQQEQLATRLARDQERRRAIEEERSARSAELPPVEAEVQQLRQQLVALRTAFERVERQLRELRRAYEQEQQQERQYQVQLAETRTRLAGLTEHAREHLDVDDPSRLPEPPADFDVQAAREQIETLRRRMANLGTVNELALEQYQEEKERLDFLLAQQQDLESAEATLETTIQEINQTAAARFLETFESIRRNFQELFRELFGGDARADLVLADPNDPLESPIEILARPRGKRPSTLAQLSGGEKALTAIALLFALYLTKPSPFCILDEVDAPLDEANVERFMRLLRSFSENTQFILITHNLRTMELSDRLYGVTMQEPGVSTLVSVRLEEAAELAGR
ncbi:chromosome segregation protein SMC [Rhodothermus marinus]|uniref:chromosome segregation protein SMC n=1 Tax=Rhodothermus marinus TaxID=29549 RepID=UPI001F554BB9|nr:chromosome segregation protein SMC [Rhodothermus marinus]